MNDSSPAASRTANLLGAAALAIGERMLAAATGVAGVSTSGSAALVRLVAEPGIGVTELGERIGLSQPAAARMMDSLAAHGLAERRPGTSGRSVAVHPTRKGRAAARRVLQARQGELGGLIERLSPEERESLTNGLEKILDRLFDEVGSEYVLCRLCDTRLCLTEGQLCPVGQAALDRGGGSG
ncbi:MAG: MarR family transcriptional regulator [Streptosporangiales bacterium]|nr:MarR family transcriptional regulator [Streptosporangiales bacterium]